MTQNLLSVNTVEDEPIRSPGWDSLHFHPLPHVKIYSKADRFIDFYSGAI